MNKATLVETLSAKTSITKTDCEKVLNAFVATVGETLKKGDSIQLVGFGTFAAAKRAARTGKNPQTGKAIKIPATVVPKFKAGKALKDIVAKAKVKK